MPLGLLAAPAVYAIACTYSFASSPEETGPILFTNITQVAGIDFVETIGDHDMTNIVEATGVGCGFLDFDNDGWMDIYLVSGRWLEGLSDKKLDPDERKKLSFATDRLYRNRGNGTFDDVTVRAGLARPAYGMGVVVADYDADGDSDIYVTNFGPNALYRNNGNGTFTDVARKCRVDDPHFSVGAVFFDYDRDGRLDLYVGNYLTYDPDYKHHFAPDGFPGPLAYVGQQDRLFRGNSNGTFTDVTEKSGIVMEPVGRAMGVGALDYDNDGFLDIFVSNDAMENFLLRNKGNGSFENLALSAGVAYGENGDATAAMAVEIGDLEGDGFLDVLVPDMTYSCLYHNLDGGVFEDMAARSGLSVAVAQYHSWGGALADFNLDGRLDIYISNADVHHLEAHEDVLLLGDTNGRFLDVSATAGDWIAKHKHVGRGIARSDFDNDGDVDLLVAGLNGHPALLRNDTPRQKRHWIEVELVGRPPNRDAIGAVVTVRTGNKTQVRPRLSGGGYLSQHDSRLHFGLGEQSRVDHLEVIWPDGSRQTKSALSVDQLITIKQESATRRKKG